MLLIKKSNLAHSSLNLEEFPWLDLPRHMNVGSSAAPKCQDDSFNVMSSTFILSHADGRLRNLESLLVRR